MSRFVKVAHKSDVAEGTGICVEVDGKQIGLFNAGGTFYAIDDTCTHEGAPLSEGSIEGEEVVCPWHGALFDLKSGEATGPPADEGVSAYKVRVTGDDVEIEVK